jgi:hypothetical protein
MRLLPALLVAILAAGFSQIASADTTEVKTQTIVEVKKKGEHCEQDPNCFNRYHPAIKPVARAKPGDLIVVHTRDALDSNLNLNSQPKDVTAIDLNLIHPMTGPIYIEGATFSISNLGMLGIDSFDAIVNPPQVGILAIGSTRELVVVEENELVIRKVANLTLTCDHRAIDGATGANFLATLRTILESSEKNSG